MAEEGVEEEVVKSFLGMVAVRMGRRVSGSVERTNGRERRGEIIKKRGRDGKAQVEIL